VYISVKRISDWSAPGSTPRWSVLAGQFRLLVRDLGDAWSYYASRPRTRVARVSKAEYPDPGDWPAELAHSVTLQRKVVNYLNDVAYPGTPWDMSWVSVLNELTDEAGKQ
jgi:hypothetical protein